MSPGKKSVQKWLTPVLLLPALAAGCASSERLIRLGPAGECYRPPAEARIRDGAFGSVAGRAPAAVPATLINIWPLFFRSDDYVSVLWPLMDLDRYGWAVRPWFNREGNEFSILFPLAAWNPVNGDGWAGNVYWNRERFGAFPLFHFSDGFSFILPVFWNRREGRLISYGVLPLALRRKAGFSFAGPFWWEASAESWAGGVFPVAGFRSSGINHVGPVWWDFRRVSGLKDFGVFPVFRYASAGSQYCFPLYIIWREGRGVLTPLAGWFCDGRRSMFSILGPLYLRWQFRSPPGEESLPGMLVESDLRLWGGLAVSEVRRRLSWKSSRALPWRLRSWRSIAADRELAEILLNRFDPELELPASPEEMVRFVRQVRDRHTFISEGCFAGFLPVAAWGREGEFRSLWILPCLYESAAGELRHFSLLGPFGFIWNRDRSPGSFGLPLRRTSWLALLLLSGCTFRETPVTEPRLDDLKQAERLIYANAGSEAEFRSRLLRVAPDLELPERTCDSGLRRDLVESAARRAGFRVRVDCTAWCLPLFWYKDTTEQFRLFLPALVTGWSRDGDSRRFGSLPLLSWWNSTADSDAFAVLFPLWYRWREPEASGWRLLGWLARQERRGTDRSHFSILEYLFRHRRSGVESETLIFPFISVRRSGDEALSWSFLWRVLDYHRRGGRSGGHLFFIPFGDPEVGDDWTK